MSKDVQVRKYLDVPFSDNAQANAAGARWDPKVRRWYAPRGYEQALSRWKAIEGVPLHLPGEDRSLGQGLFVDLVPSSCWFTNVRSCVSELDWERIRRMVIPRAGDVCEICGRGPDRKVKRWMEVHERWVFDEAQLVQRLGRLICLCTDCHVVTHFGLAEVRGQAEQATAHLMAVTGLSREMTLLMIEVAFETWAQRSQRVWTLDLSILVDAGVQVIPPPSARGRDVQAWLELQFGR